LYGRLKKRAAQKEKGGVVKYYFCSSDIYSLWSVDGAVPFEKNQLLAT
jgi:YHS domain-containing protein